ncbi:MAG TPA: hypothetical protein VMS54_06170 [Vicinamibacterales bacterium]|nr:hypothetical protein [Vicinamibacterales bacterium]
MQQAQPQPSPFVVTVIREPADEMSVPELIIGSLGIAGSLLLLALVCGAVAGVVLVVWNKFHPPVDRHLPSVSPQVPVGRPPNTPTQ